MHTAIGICHTGYADCLLSESGWNCSSISLVFCKNISHGPESRVVRRSVFLCQVSLFQGDISKTFILFCYLQTSTFHISGLCGICLRRMPWRPLTQAPLCHGSTKPAAPDDIPSIRYRKKVCLCTSFQTSVSYALVGKYFTGVAPRCCIIDNPASHVLVQPTAMQQWRERVVQHRTKVCICAAPLDSSTAQCLLKLCVV